MFTCIYIWLGIYILHDAMSHSESDLNWTATKDDEYEDKIAFSQRFDLFYLLKKSIIWRLSFFNYLFFLYDIYFFFFFLYTCILLTRIASNWTMNILFFMPKISKKYIFSSKYFRHDNKKSFQKRKKHLIFNYSLL